MPRKVPTMDCNRERFRELVKNAGYDSVRQYALANGLHPQSIQNNLSNSYGLSVEKVFEYANNLHVPFEEIVKLFYPRLYEENSKYR